MLKFTVIAGAIALTAPASAQTAASAPTSVDLAGPPTGGPTTTAIPASADQLPAPAAQPAAARPGASQVADVVSAEFPSYDKNGDGVLSAAEFDTWMVALKTVNDPATNAASPATRTWLTQAFAQADSDKNKKLSKSELTAFLTQQG